MLHTQGRKGSFLYSKLNHTSASKQSWKGTTDSEFLYVLNERFVCEEERERYAKEKRIQTYAKASRKNTSFCVVYFVKIFAGVAHTAKKSTSFTRIGIFWNNHAGEKYFHRKHRRQCGLSVQKYRIWFELISLMHMEYIRIRYFVTFVISPSFPCLLLLCSESKGTYALTRPAKTCVIVKTLQKIRSISEFKKMNG